MEATKLIENSEIKTVSENFLTIPATEAKVIPGSPERTVELPLFLKNESHYYRLDTKSKCITLWLASYNKQITISDYGEFSSGEVDRFLKQPDQYEIITEDQFNEAFSSALSAIATAHGSLVSISRVPQPEDYDSDFDSDLLNDLP